MFDSENAGEEFLKDSGLIARRSASQRQVLACFACRWHHTETAGETPVAYGYEVIKCSGILAGTLYPILARLEESGVVVSENEAINPAFEGRPGRRYYSPAQTDVGTEFKNALPVPEDCPLSEIES
ncbi:MAG TPA: hypothetical protein VLE69_01415 [Candidatus Saccharimonadales bacterium]|nr:hypothetical protein [Candidatus Saccharimonadales bacterium]